VLYGIPNPGVGRSCRRSRRNLGRSVPTPFSATGKRAEIQIRAGLAQRCQLCLQAALDTARMRTARVCGPNHSARYIRYNARSWMLRRRTFIPSRSFRSNPGLGCLPAARSDANTFILFHLHLHRLRTRLDASHQVAARDGTLPGTYPSLRLFGPEGGQDPGRTALFFRRP